MHLTDRSRWELGVQECQTKRYWQYHYDKLGLVPLGTAIELWTGLLVHAALANLLVCCKGSSQPTQAQQRQAWKLAATEALAEPPACSEFTKKEQLWLAESLYWGFVRTQLPYLLEHYEVVAVEQEIELELEPDMLLMTRPDLVVRRRSDGRLVLVDFKTTKSVTDAFIKEFSTSPQMAGYTLAAEKFFGEPIEEYMIWALIKGGRDKFSKKGGLETAESRQYSPLCYAKFQEPNPPLSPETAWDLRGYWYDKSPAWEVVFSQQEPSESPSECWIRLLDKSLVLEQFAIIGPYPRQEYTGQSFLENLKGEEHRWKNKLGMITSLDPAEHMQQVVQHIGQSYQCWTYGSRCTYYELCFGPLQNPMDTGRFKRRIPHHERELKSKS